MKDYRDKAKSMQGDKLERYGAPAKRANGGGLRQFVDDYVAPGLPTNVGSAIASGIRKLRGPSETEKAVKDVAVDGAIGAGAGHLGRAARFGRGMSMDGQEDRARGGRLGKGK